MASDPDEEVDDVFREITEFLAGCLDHMQATRDTRLDLDLRHLLDGLPEPLRGLLGGHAEHTKHIQHEFESIVKRTIKFDPVAVSALRVVHAVLVAARRQDEESLAALREWEKHTLSYMQKHAFDEYLKLGLPPRPVQRRQDRHDRHLIVASLAGQIANYLKQCDQEARVPPTGPLANFVTHEAGIAVCLGMMVTTAFPDLRLVEGEKKARLLARIQEHRAIGRPLAELDPEEIILDVLENWGVPRPTGHNWLRAIK